MSAGFSMLMEDGTIEYHGDGPGPSPTSLAIFASMQKLIDQREKENKEKGTKEEKTDQNAANVEKSSGYVTAGNGAAGSADGLPLDIAFNEAMDDEGIEKVEEQEEKEETEKKKRRSNPSKKKLANKGKK